MGINALISEYNSMSQKGTVPFYEGTVFIEISDYFREGSQYNESLKALAIGIQYHPYCADLFVAKAKLLLETNQEDLSLIFIDKALACSPNDVAILSIKLEILTEYERFEEAKDVLALLKQTSIGSDSMDNVYFLQGNLYDMMEDFDMSFQSFSESIRRNPRNTEALSKIWFATEYCGRYEDSVTLHQFVIDQNPYSHLAWFNLGEAYAGLEDYSKAVEALEYAFIVNEDFEMAYRSCAATCIKLGWYKKALKCYQELSERIEQDSDILTQMGYCYECMGELSKGENYYARAVMKNPKDHDAHYRMGQCLSKGRKWKASISSYTRAVELDGRKDRYLHALAEAYLKIGDLDQGEIYLQKATEIAPEVQDYWIRHVEVLLKQGQIDRCHEVLEDAEINAFGPFVLYCRSACYFEEGRRQEALQTVIEALQMDNGYEHNLLFNLTPYLEQDKDVLNLITTFSRS